MSRTSIDASEAPLDRLKEFDVTGATVALWVFKKSSSSDRGVVFTGRWIQTTDALDIALKSAVNSERDRITEVHEYTILGQTNESSALTISTLETHAGLIVDQAAANVQTKKITKVKDLQNAAFYATKLVSGDKVLYGVKKADFSWRTSKSISVFFSDNTLDLSKEISFDIAPSIDFFILKDSIVISQKAHFESVLNYKLAHIDDFDALRKEPDFQAIFSSLDELLKYVGENKMQLRRASAIRQKGHYRNPDFMVRLRTHHKSIGLNLEFDATGKIKPSLETCRDIFQALLDHRLSSVTSTNVYDVPDAAKVSV